MLCGAIILYGVLKSMTCNRRQNSMVYCYRIQSSKAYCKTLYIHLLRFAADIFRERQANMPEQIAPSFRVPWRLKFGYQTMVYALYFGFQNSPDLKRIENVWEHLAKELYNRRGNFIHSITRRRLAVYMICHYLNLPLEGLKLYKATPIGLNPCQEWVYQLLCINKDRFLRTGIYRFSLSVRGGNENFMRALGIKCFCNELRTVMFSVVSC